MNFIACGFFGKDLLWLLFSGCLVQLFAIPWTEACQAPLSMGIIQARILDWMPCPPPGDLPNPGIKPMSPALQADALTSEPPGKPVLGVVVDIFL